MKKIQLLLLIVGIALTAISCKQEEVKDTNSELQGSWEWVRTDGGIGYNIHDTPESTGKNIEMKFSNGNKYSINTNGTVTEEGTYTLAYKKCIHSQKELLTINFSDSEYLNSLMIHEIGTKLLLDDEVYDGTAIEYKRK